MNFKSSIASYRYVTGICAGVYFIFVPSEVIFVGNSKNLIKLMQVFHGNRSDLDQAVRIPADLDPYSGRNQFVFGSAKKLIPDPYSNCGS
jgi:hypothetical protein